MTKTEAKARREAILALTADLREKIGKVGDELQAVRAEISEIDYPCARLTRLGDKEWDLSAKHRQLSEMIDNRVERYVASL